MQKQYTIPLDITKSYRSSSGGASSTTLNWSTAYSSKYFGRNSTYRFAATMRSESELMQKMQQLNPSKIVSITLSITAASYPSYDIAMYCGPLASATGKSTISSSNRVTWLKNAQSMQFDITSYGIPATLGYAIGDNTSNAIALTLSSASLIVTVDEGLDGKVFIDGTAHNIEQSYISIGGSWHSIDGTKVCHGSSWHNQ